MEKPPENHPFIIYFLAICATVGGLLFGYDTGIINGAILLIADEFTLSDRWIESIVASTVGAAAVFSLFSGVVADAIGRKTTIMLSAVIFTVGGLLMGLANSPEMILVGRLVVGASIGFVSSVVPVYVSECAPHGIRGRLITLNQLFITIGIVLSAILAGALQSFGNTGWRLMLGLAAIPGVLQLICFIGLPESPRYQMMKGQEAKAEQTLKKIRALDDVSIELAEIRTSLEEEKESKGLKIWKRIFTTPHVRKALFIGCMLQFFQQFCGINTVIYYSATILKGAGFDASMAIWLSVVPATINFLATFIGLWAVESLGRKLILAISFLAIAASLLVLCTAFLLSQHNSPETTTKYEHNVDKGKCMDYTTCYECTLDYDCGYCYVENYNEGTMGNGSCMEVDIHDTLYSVEGRCSIQMNASRIIIPKINHVFTYKYCPSKYAYIAVLGLMLYVLGFAPGAGPMPWTINAEIYPLWCRSIANSMATVTNWTCNLIVSFTFISLLKALTAQGTFLMFSVVCVLGAIFVFVMVPETKDKPLEEVELLFMTKSKRDEVLANRYKTEEAKTEEPVAEEVAEILSQTVGESVTTQPSTNK